MNPGSFPLAGGVPPQASDLNWGAPWGLSVPFHALFRPLELLICLLLVVSGRMALSMPAGGSVGGGGVGVSCAALSFPSPPSPPLPFLPTTPSSSSSPFPGPLGLLRKSRGLATMWAAPPRVVNYPGHDGPGLLLGRPPRP